MYSLSNGGLSTPNYPEKTSSCKMMANNCDAIIEIVSKKNEHEFVEFFVILFLREVLNKKDIDEVFHILFRREQVKLEKEKKEDIIEACANFAISDFSGKGDSLYLKLKEILNRTKSGDGLIGIQPIGERAKEYELMKNNLPSYICNNLSIRMVFCLEHRYKLLTKINLLDLIKHSRNCIQIYSTNPILANTGEEGRIKNDIQNILSRITSFYEDNTLLNIFKTEKERECVLSKHRDESVLAKSLPPLKSKYEQRRKLLSASLLCSAQLNPIEENDSSSLSSSSITSNFSSSVVLPKISRKRGSKDSVSSSLAKSLRLGGSHDYCSEENPSIYLSVSSNNNNEDNPYEECSSLPSLSLCNTSPRRTEPESYAMSHNSSNSDHEESDYEEPT